MFLIAEFSQAEGSDSDTSVESQDYDNVSFKVALAEEEDISDGMSTPSTAEPELFMMDDISEEGSLTSQGEIRPPIPISEPPRFNTPKLRTPTPPILPRFEEGLATSPVVETGPLLINTAPHVPVSTPIPDYIVAAPRARLVKQTSLDAEHPSENPFSNISSDITEEISLNSSVYVSHKMPNGVTAHCPIEDTTSMNHVTDNLGLRHRCSGHHPPFPWGTYIFFTVCCGFCGSLIHIHPFWFIIIIALVSLVSFRYTIPSSVG